MKRALTILSLVFAVSSLVSSGDVWAKERRVALQVAGVSGIGADCKVPTSGFTVAYKTLSKSRLQFLKKVARQKRGAATFTKMVKEGDTGRVFKTTIKGRSVSVTELAFMIDGRGSCEFRFKGSKS